MRTTHRPVTDDELDGIDGWFLRLDREIFRFLLGPAAAPPSGDLAELGVYLGKSAVLIGAYRRPGETFTVVDLFGSDGADAANAAEVDESYGGLSRQRFEDNYRRIHDDLPVVVHGPSATIVQHATHGGHRFVHVDASHLYEHVVGDIAAARTLLQPQGLVAFDDYQTGHALGVAAAVWREVAIGGLAPVLASPAKLYCTWGDPAPWRAAAEDWARRGPWRWQRLSIAGHDVVRVWEPETRMDRWLPPSAAPWLHRARGRLRRSAGRRAPDREA